MSKDKKTGSKPVYIPNEIHSKLKAKTALKGESLKQVVQVIIEKYVNER